MDQIVIISDLLNWLEKNLDNLENRLSLDKVAKKAGYSKWHLQRMFKEITGHAIGAYIRARRLSRAAVALRLTSRPILDIALQYRFDSQQTFTRAFKKQFSVTPAIYRRSEDWNAHGIRPPIRLDDYNYRPPTHEFVTLPRTPLVGLTQRYTCSLDQLYACRLAVRVPFWQYFLSKSSSVPPLLYGLSDTRPNPEKDDEQELFYTAALPAPAAEQYIDGIVGVCPVELPQGDYVKFTYEGPSSGFQSFVLTLYGSCMPELNLVRRKAPDVEMFYPQEEYGEEEEERGNIRCDYLIPVRL